jgi:hypothetical protein
MCYAHVVFTTSYIITISINIYPYNYFFYLYIYIYIYHTRTLYKSLRTSYVTLAIFKYLIIFCKKYASLVKTKMKRKKIEKTNDLYESLEHKAV